MSRITPKRINDTQAKTVTASLPTSVSAIQLAADAFNLSSIAGTPIYEFNPSFKRNIKSGNTITQLVNTIDPTSDATRVPRVTGTPSGSGSNSGIRALGASRAINKQGQPLTTVLPLLFQDGYYRKGTWTFPATGQPWTRWVCYTPKAGVYSGVSAMGDRWGSQTLFEHVSPQRFKVGFANNLINIWNYHDGTAKTNYSGTNPIPFSMQPYDNNANMFAVASDGTNIRFWHNGEQHTLAGNLTSGFTDDILGYFDSFYNAPIDYYQDGLIGSALTNANLLQMFNQFTSSIGYLYTRVICIGSSLVQTNPAGGTSGSQAADDLSLRNWPANVQRLMKAQGINQTLETLNWGRSSLGAQYFAANINTILGTLSARPNACQREVIAMMGMLTNDIANNRTPTQMRDDLRTICTALVASGRFANSFYVAMTEIARTGQTGVGGTGDLANAMLRSEFVTGGAGTCRAILEAGSITVGFIDLALSPFLNPQNAGALTATVSLVIGGIPFTGTIFNPDQIHLTFTGSAFVAEIILNGLIELGIVSRSNL
jgi:hypothetical protein